MHLLEAGAMQRLDSDRAADPVQRSQGHPHRTGAAPHPAWERLGVPALTVLPAGSRPAEGAVVDSDGVLLPWMAERRAASLALRPDAYVYAAAPAGAPLPPPPAGFSPVPRTATPITR